MKSIIRLIMLLLLIVGWGLAALSLHCIRTNDEIPITLVPKDRLGLTDTYVDTRAWTIDDVAQHQELVAKLLRVHKEDVLKNLTSDAHGDLVAQLTDALQRAARKDSAATKAARSTTVEQAAHSFLGLF
jgi:hypothetical protein